jgi:predicted nucleic acid-binding protein
MGLLSRGMIVDLDSQIAVHAAHIPNELKLAIADSIIVATLWTQDEHFKAIEGYDTKRKG